MKKLILIFLLFIPTIFCYGQKTYKILYENGQLKETGQFDVNEKQTGEWKKYYENGKLYHVVNYENGVFKGEWKFYDENGKLTNILHSENGLSENFDENGKLWCIGKYKNGIDKIGEWKYYFPNGLTKRIENYKDGKLNGEYKSYEYNNGKVYIYSKGKYENGKEVGEWKYYFENGKQKEI